MIKILMATYNGEKYLINKIVNNLIISGQYK